MSLEAVGAGLQIAGAGMAFAGERAAGKAAEEAAEYNAEVLRQEAKATLVEGSAEALRLLRAGRRLTAANIAAVGAGGGLLTGSKLLAIADVEAEIELEKRDILRNAQAEATGLLGQADIAIWEGKQARKAGNIRALTALFGGLGTAAIGFAGAKINSKLPGNQAAIKRAGGLKSVADKAYRGWFTK